MAEMWIDVEDASGTRYGNGPIMATIETAAPGSFGIQV